MRTAPLVLALSLVSAVSAFALHRQETTNLSALTQAARSDISAALGCSLPAYHVRARATGLHAEDPRRPVSIDFTADGVELHTGAAHWQMKFARYGDDEGLKPSTQSFPTGNCNRVEYRRGALTEWYVNGPAGLEQGFTLEKAPVRSESGRLTIALALSGDLTAIDQGQNVVALVDRAGVRRLRYSRLAARDALGKELPASLELEHDRFLLKVDDRGARYPVTVDPWIETAELTSSDGGDNDGFGSAVAISGNTIVVGAPGHTIGPSQAQGAAYVFVEPSGGWGTMVQTAELTASNGAANAAFGSSVAISGNTIVVGANGATVHGNPYEGAAYVFVQPTGGWSNMTQTAELTASDGSVGAAFGESVAISGSTVVVGSPYATVGTQMQQGAAYVYVAPGGGWANATETAKLTSSDGAASDLFGVSVAASGSTVLVGASGATINDYPSEGAAYVFAEPVSGWVSATQTAKLTASDGLADSYFGSSVGISGNTAVVGAPSDFVGAAYVFVQPAKGWGNMTQTAELTVSGMTSKLLLGGSISISGGVVVAGAVGDTIKGGANEGAVYMFQQPSTGWADMAQTYQWTANDGAGGDNFGHSVATGLITAVSGSPNHAVGSNRAQGAAYVYQTVNPRPSLTALSPSSAAVGGSGFILTVQGSSFVQGAVVNWNGAPLANSSYKSQTAVTATVSASDLATAGNVRVTVTNPAPGGGVSNALTFSVNNAAPEILSCVPSAALAGGASFTLTVNGSNFASKSKVYWNGSQIPTTFVSSSKLTATVFATSIVTAGTAQVTVENPAPGGGTSNAETFAINNPVSALTALLPANIKAGSLSFSLTITGTGFVSGSQVTWNGSNRATTYVTAHKVTATITALDILTAGTAQVRVTNPKPGGGTSNSLVFTIKP